MAVRLGNMHPPVSLVNASAGASQPTSQVGSAARETTWTEALKSDWKRRLLDGEEDWFPTREAPREAKP